MVLMTNLGWNIDPWKHKSKWKSQTTAVHLRSCILGTQTPCMHIADADTQATLITTELSDQHLLITHNPKVKGHKGTADATQTDTTRYAIHSLVRLLLKIWIHTIGILYQRPNIGTLFPITRTGLANMSVCSLWLLKKLLDPTVHKIFLNISWYRHPSVNCLTVQSIADMF